MSTATGPVIDSTTITSLLYTLALLAIAYLASLRLLPGHSTNRTRVLFVWHAWDALVHLFVEGGFVYNCFFTYVEISHPERLSALVDSAAGKVVAVTGAAAGLFAAEAGIPGAPLVTPPGVHFLAQGRRLYGAGYGTGAMARLWQEYAKADRRWGGVDLGVLSLEMLTVFVGGPLALYVCCLLVREGDVVGRTGKSRIGARAAFWMTVLATGELYGGFMTFAPEWLTGSPNLDTSNWMYLWLYLVFFNTLWVFLPLYALYETYGSFVAADAEIAVEKKQT